MDIRYVGIRLGTTRAGAPSGPLTTIVRDSDGNQFTVTNQVFSVDTNSFIVAADVKDSDGNNFTVFT